MSVPTKLHRAPQADIANLDDGQLRALASRLQAENESLASLSNFLQMQVEREKATLARDLHDTLGGILTPAKMDLAWLEAHLGTDPQCVSRLKRLGTLIDQGIDFKRRIIEVLRPSLLDHLGLASALQWHVAETCRSANVECRLSFSDQLGRLPPDLEIALYRLVQEIIQNVVLHAKAKAVDLNLGPEPGGLRLVVSDDGVGIADLESAKSLSHGLAGMMHRVRSVGGSFEISSNPGQGTRVEVFVPLK